jgi:hypothetical protein
MDNETENIAQLVSAAIDAQDFIAGIFDGGTHGT